MRQGIGAGTKIKIILVYVDVSLPLRPHSTPCIVGHVLVTRGLFNFKERKSVTGRTVERNVEREEFCIKNGIILQSSIFWNITPCSPLDVNRRFGGTYHLHPQGRRISQARNQRESMWQAPFIFYLISFQYISFFLLFSFLSVFLCSSFC
jgi:hypothetical protein